MNKELLIKIGAEKVVENVAEDINIKIEDLYDEDEIHDLLCGCKINGIKIDKDDDLYNEMLSLLDEELCNEIHDKVEEELDNGATLQEQWKGYYSDLL